MKRLALAAPAALLVTLLAAAPALAAGGVTIRSVDTRSFPEVRLSVQVSGETPKVSDFHVRENGELLPDSRVEVRPLKQTASPVGTVLVIDTSGSMKAKGALDQAKAAARQFIDAKQPNDWIALVAFSSQAVLKSDFTQDGGALLAAVDGLVPSGETALWDGVVQAARLYEKHPELQPNVLLLSDGADTVSGATQEQAVSALSGVHAAVFAIGIQSEEFDPALLNGLVTGTSGSLATSTNPADLTKQFEQVRRAIANQYEVVYRSPSDGGALSIGLTVGDLSIETQTRAGSLGVAPEPTVIKASGGLLSGTVGRLAIVVMVALAVGLLGGALLLIFWRREQGIDHRLGYYGGSRSAGAGAAEVELAETGFVQRAVEMTSKMADRAGLLEKVDALLEQANLPLRAAEALFFYVAGVLVVGLLGLLTAPSLPVGLMAVVAVAFAPVATVKMLTRKRLHAFEAQLPDTLNLLAGSLRAGYSFLQGVEAVAQEASDPIARELRRVLAEARLGRPMEDALADTAARMNSRDFEWAVLAIRIQREVGGNLAELLSTVADTMVQRGRLKGEIKTLTAEGRISAIIMGCLPVALGGFLFMSSPDYIGKLFSSTAGWIMVLSSAALAGAGFVWLRKIVKIEV